MRARRSPFPCTSSSSRSTCRSSWIRSEVSTRAEGPAMWRIPYVNLAAPFAAEKSELMARIERVLATGMHIGGSEVEALEQEISAYVGTRHGVELKSGTDWLNFARGGAGIGPWRERAPP